MKLKHIYLAGVAAAALSVGIVDAQARSTTEEDAITRQLNLEQLDSPQSYDANAPIATPTRDGQGGPEFQGPPKPDEGMTDEDSNGDEGAKTDDQDDQNVPPPPEDNTPSQEPMPAPKPY